MTFLSFPDYDKVSGVRERVRGATVFAKLR
jgi:hypothetical protein